MYDLAGVFTLTYLDVAIEGRNNNWDFDALISTYNFVQLTPEIPEKVGWAFTKEVRTFRV